MHHIAALSAVAAIALVGGLTVPAHAKPSESSNRPAWAGPPMVETGPVTESDPPTFLCDDRVVVFTGGNVTFRGRELPNDRYLGIITLRGATASDGKTTYRAVGGARFMGTNDEQSGVFSVHITLIGPGGEVERVNSTTRVRNGEMSLAERGSCTVQE